MSILKWLRRPSITMMAVLGVHLVQKTSIRSVVAQQPEDEATPPGQQQQEQNEDQDHQEEGDGPQSDTSSWNTPFDQSSLDIFKYLDNPPFPCASLQNVLAGPNDDGEEVMFVRLSSSVIDDLVANSTSYMDDNSHVTTAETRQSPASTSSVSSSSTFEQLDPYICIETPTLDDANVAEGDRSTTYRITIKPDRLGRYEFIHRPEGYYDYISSSQNEGGSESDMADGVGFAWNEPSDGIVYCVSSDSTPIIFNTFVEDAVLSITVRTVPDNEICESHILGFDGYTPMDPGPQDLPDDTSPNAVVWSAPRFFLRADHFSYTITTSEGEVVTFSLANATDVFVNGDPGSDTYMSIEVYWNDDSFEGPPDGDQGAQEQVVGTPELPARRFYAYFESDGRTWRMFEARVYNEAQEWITFTLSDQVEGTRDACFEREELELSSPDGDAGIVFKNIKLAVFLPWEINDAMLACMDPFSASGEGEEHFDQDNDPISAGPLDGNLSVLWSSPRYILEASAFEYSIIVPGQPEIETGSLLGAQNIVVDGDPGWDYDSIPDPDLEGGYMTIEIEWLSGVDGSQQRFYGYFSSNSSHYNMFEARVRSIYKDEWESFENLEGVIAAPLGSCFAQESVVIKNSQGSEVSFDNLVLAAFLPWDDIDAPTLAVEARSSSASTLQFGSEAYCNALVSSQPDSTPSSGGNFNENTSEGGSGANGSDGEDTDTENELPPNVAFENSNARTVVPSIGAVVASTLVALILST